MTREEAIRELKYAKAMCEFDPMTGEYHFHSEEDRRQSEAFGIAIKALEEESALIDRVSEIVEKRMSTWYAEPCDNPFFTNQIVMRAVALVKEDIEQLKNGDLE